MDKIMKYLRENFVWIKDIVMVIGMIAVVWLNSHFVTIEKFEAYKKENDAAHVEIQKVLSGIDKTLALMNQQAVMLIEHDKQIRLNTIKLAEHDILINKIKN